MTRSDNIYRLPADLPVPIQDGLADHLPGLLVARVPLLATTGEQIELWSLPGRSVVYCYPRTGRPGQEPPVGWNLIPGMRGCTPQSCSFRDHHRQIIALDARVFGLSTQDTEDQREATERLHLPYPLLSDSRLEFASAMRLPFLEVESTRLLRRLTLIVRDGVVEHVFYPVFPPDRNAEEVLMWLTVNRTNAEGKP